MRPTTPRREKPAMYGSRTVARAVVVVLTALAAVVGAVPGGAAAADGESIPSFDSRIDVDTRGDLHVTETIEYDFAGDQRHGLQRELSTRFAQPGGGRDRTYPVSGVVATSPSGAPAQVAVSQDGALTVIRVGDPQQTVSGRQTYELRYTVAGAFNRITTPTPLRDGTASLPPHDELYWNVTGSGWKVPIGRVTVAVTAPQGAAAAPAQAEPSLVGQMFGLLLVLVVIGGLGLLAFVMLRDAEKATPSSRRA